MAYAGSGHIKGFDEVFKNLNAEIKNIKGRTMKGLLKSAIKIRRDMDHTPPVIPVDYGNLRASWFVVSAKKVESNPPSFKGDNASNIEQQYSAAVGEAVTMTQSNPNALFLVIGFGANYAAPVHEMIDPGINWKRKNSGPKFFQRAVYANKDTILKIIKENAQIK